MSNDLVQRLRDMCGNDPNTVVTQAADEIERMTTIASELQDLCDRQAKRLAEVEKDAARYHFLRENSYIELFCDSPQVEGWKPEMLDASIDAAMEAK